MFQRLKRQLCIALLLTVGLTLSACGLAPTEMPATLRVKLPTPIPTSPPLVAPSPTTLAGVDSLRPVDPAVTALLDQVTSDRMIYAISALVGMKTRHVLSASESSSSGINAARDWLYDEFRAIRDRNPEKEIAIWTQPFTYRWRIWDVSAENVVAVFPGSNIGAGVIVIGAHYDSVADDPFNGKSAAPGANENGSGVAIMLELMHILAPIQHRATLVFVGFSAKESGLQGSTAFVEEYAKARQIDLRGMINLDTLGSNQESSNFSSTAADRRVLRLFSAAPNESPSRQFARQLALFISLYVNDLNLVLQSSDERTGRIGDHQSFSNAGYAAARFMQGLEPTQSGARDTVDSIELPYLMRTARAILAGVLLMADGPLPPTRIALYKDSTIQKMAWTPASDAAGYLIALRATNSLYYDRVLTITVPGQTHLDWDRFSQYATVAIGAIDSAGRVGPLSQEMPIAGLANSLP